MDWGRSERIARKAAEWVVLVDSDSFDGRAAARLKQWLAKSIEHADAFRLASRVWGDLDGLERLRPYPDLLNALKSAPSGASGERVRPNRRALVLGAGAVSAVAGVGVIAVLASGPDAIYETGIGERSEALLPDGTRLHLNADTRIEAHVDDIGREVRIVRGEALIEIVQSGAGPFRIVGPGGAIEADSGAVLVKHLPNGLRVSLLSGAARATRSHLFGASAPTDAAPNDQILLGGGTIVIEPVASDRLARATLWRDGMLSFEATPLVEATADVTRQTGVRFTFEDAALGAMRIGGLIRADDVDGFLELLRINLAIRSERRGNEIILHAPDA